MIQQHSAQQTNGFRSGWLRQLRKHHNDNLDGLVVFRNNEEKKIWVVSMQTKEHCAHRPHGIYTMKENRLASTNSCEKGRLRHGPRGQLTMLFRGDAIHISYGRGDDITPKMMSPQPESFLARRLQRSIYIDSYNEIYWIVSNR
jgi:hypothetical protein